MGSKFKGTASQLTALNAYIALTRAVRSTSERIHSSLPEWNLSIGQLAVLDALYHCGPMRLNEVAEKILTTGANLTTIVDNLEKRGLVQRLREESDRRCITLRLTEPGTVLFEQLLPSHTARIYEELSVLTDAEQKELRRLCRKLGLGNSARSTHTA